MTGRELKRWLAEQGAVIVESKGKGSHAKVYLHGKQTVMPTHSGEIPTGTLGAIFRQLGLKRPRN